MIHWSWCLGLLLLDAMVWWLFWLPLQWLHPFFDILSKLKGFGFRRFLLRALPFLIESQLFRLVFFLLLFIFQQCLKYIHRLPTSRLWKCRSKCWSLYHVCISIIKPWFSPNNMWVKLVRSTSRQMLYSDLPNLMLSEHFFIDQDFYVILPFVIRTSMRLNLTLQLADDFLRD